MTVSVLVPFRPDGAERDRNWRWLRARLEGEHPGWEIVEASCGDGPWNKPAAVNRAARRSSGDVLVVSDADVFVAGRALDAAVARVRHAAWVVPHGPTRRLTEAATAAVVEGADPRRARTYGRTRVAGAGGGLLVVPRAGFELVGGMDENFAGWGFEDVAFALALDALVGPHVRLDAPLFHLWHRPQPRPDPPKGRPAPNRARYRAYLEARARGTLDRLVKEPADG